MLDHGVKEHKTIVHKSSYTVENFQATGFQIQPVHQERIQVAAGGFLSKSLASATHNFSFSSCICKPIWTYIL
jgi:hypothetical protein